MYQIATGANNVSTLTNISPQPAMPEGIHVARVLMGGDGMPFDDGYHIGEMVFDGITETDYTSLLTQFGLNNQRAQRVTLYARDADRQWRTYNATLIKPERPRFRMRIAQQLRFEIIDASEIVYGEMSLTSPVTLNPDDTPTLLAVWDTEEESVNTTLDTISHSITVQGAGTFQIDATINADGDATTTYTIKLAVNGIEDDDFSDFYLTTGTEAFDLTVTGTRALASGDVLTLTIISDNGVGATLNVNTGNFTIARVD
jgi:hypothetical protein